MRWAFRPLPSRKHRVWSPERLLWQRGFAPADSSLPGERKTPTVSTPAGFSVSLLNAAIYCQKSTRKTSRVGVLTRSSSLSPARFEELVNASPDGASAAACGTGLVQE